MTSSSVLGPIPEVADAIARAREVVFLTGAGLSVASGIAPYRKAPDAVWSRVVTEWATLERFLEDPLAWWRTFWLAAHGTDIHRKEPNAGHAAIAQMVREHPRALVITQNIDGLHRKSGVPDAKLVEIHGRHDRFICTRDVCPRARDPLADVDLRCIEHGEIPRCPECAVPLRPLVLLFDELYESHPAYRMKVARRGLAHADVIVCVGTSFSVGITDHALQAGRASGAVLVNVNLEPAPIATMVELRGPAELVLPALALAIRAARAQR